MKKVLILCVILSAAIFSIWGFSGIRKATCDDCAPKSCSEDSECPGEGCFCDTDVGQCVSY